MMTGPQHNGEGIRDTILLVEGRHILPITELNTKINKSQEFLVESEL